MKVIQHPTTPPDFMSTGERTNPAAVTLLDSTSSRRARSRSLISCVGPRSQFAGLERRNGNCRLLTNQLSGADALSYAAYDWS